jgi:hypothetical protein
LTNVSRAVSSRQQRDWPAATRHLVPYKCLGEAKRTIRVYANTNCPETPKGNHETLCGITEAKGARMTAAAAGHVAVRAASGEASPEQALARRAQ